MISFICRFSLLFHVHLSCLPFRSQMVDAFLALQVSLSGGMFKRVKCSKVSDDDCFQRRLITLMTLRMDFQVN
jgi:hypothetical protein